MVDLSIRSDKERVTLPLATGLGALVKQSRVFRTLCGTLALNMQFFSFGTTPYLPRCIVTMMEPNLLSHIECATTPVSHSSFECSKLAHSAFRNGTSKIGFPAA